MTMKPEQDKQDAQLDQMLDQLARSYQQLTPPRAVDKLKALFQERNRKLSDEELDWLAAAGNGLQGEPEKKDDKDE